jgi:hypothetical protein
VAGLGSVLQPTVGRVTGLNAVTLAFTGVLAATMFQSTAAGMISLVEDRKTDYSRALFVAPVARLTLITGKIAGETLVALVQGACVAAFAVAAGVHLSLGQVATLLPACLLCCLLGSRPRHGPICSGVPSTGCCAPRAATAATSTRSRACSRRPEREPPRGRPRRE